MHKIQITLTCLALLLPTQAGAEKLYLGRNDPINKNGSLNNQPLLDRANSMVTLKYPTRVDFVKCGHPNAYYIPNDRILVFCHELTKLIYDQVKNLKTEEEKGWAFGGGRYFILFHEISHAMIHQYEIPISGREEDVADQLSFWMMYQYARAVESAEITDQRSNESIAKQDIFNRFRGAMLLMLAPEISTSSYADEHAFNAQRFANLNCWLYGADPSNAASLALAASTLPTGRLKKCNAEWQKIDNFVSRVVNKSPD
ncbi:DUF4344 domain-containing metallopeptidase [Thermomonas mangrovi]|uniref:DUF4344 domain-containing metallopeptidase n=1 Tax=Thermomonas mangrovi TaxID=2993316 RepID=UPI002308300B|nr:DUF4344 domain-containing metallopeptidase [Thermomonas mangrovi]